MEISSKNFCGSLSVYFSLPGKGPLSENVEVRIMGCCKILSYIKYILYESR